MNKELFQRDCLEIHWIALAWKTPGTYTDRLRALKDAIELGDLEPASPTAEPTRDTKVRLEALELYVERCPPGRDTTRLKALCVLWNVVLVAPSPISQEQFEAMVHEMDLERLLEEPAIEPMAAAVIETPAVAKTTEKRQPTPGEIEARERRAERDADICRHATTLSGKQPEEWHGCRELAGKVRTTYRMKESESLIEKVLLRRRREAIEEQAAQSRAHLRENV